MLIVFIPSDEEHDLEEDQNGTPHKGGMRASQICRYWVGFLGLTGEGTLLQTTNITRLTN